MVDRLWFDWPDWAFDAVYFMLLLVAAAALYVALGGAAVRSTLETTGKSGEPESVEAAAPVGMAHVTIPDDLPVDSAPVPAAEVGE